MTSDPSDWPSVRAILEPNRAELAALPAPPLRTAGQRTRAAALHRRGRTARTAFLREHGAQVHDELTDGGRRPARLDRLVELAAARYPGLVPDAATLAAEPGGTQRDKEGWEIDQGIFAWGLLRSPVAGGRVLTDMLRPTRTARSLLPEFVAEDRLDLGAVVIERHGDAAHVTLANLDVLNAEDNALADGLETAVDLALLDERIAVGVLRGAVMTHERYRGRRVFCAGINLTELYRGRISFVDFLLRRELGPISKIMRGLETGEPGSPDDPGARLEKPWIAVVDSFAIGGGMQLLLAFDHVIAADDSYLSLPAVQEGIVPGAGNLRLGARMGPRLARQVILGGRRILAAEPEARLICDEIVPGERIDAAVERSVEALHGSAVIANRRMLSLAEEPVDRFRDYMAAFALEQAQRLHHPEVLDTIEANWIKRKGGSA